MMIDGHCHIGKGRYKKLDKEALLQSMESCRIDRAVVVPVEEYLAVENEEGNAIILDAVRTSRGKLYGFATANPWYGDKAVGMLKKYLESGLCGIKLHPAVQGFQLNDSLVWPIIEVARTYAVPVYFHTGTPVCAMPMQLRDLAVLYPDVNFIMGHMGAHDFSYDIIHAAKNMDNIYLESSMSLSGIICGAIDEAGAHKVIFGSNMPRSRQAYELDKIRSICRDDIVFRRITGDNLLGLLEGGRK